MYVFMVCVYAGGAEFDEVFFACGPNTHNLMCLCVFVLMRFVNTVINKCVYEYSLCMCVLILCLCACLCHFILKIFGACVSAYEHSPAGDEIFDNGQLDFISKQISDGQSCLIGTISTILSFILFFRRI